MRFCYSVLTYIAENEFAFVFLCVFSEQELQDSDDQEDDDEDEGDDGGGGGGGDDDDDW